MMNSSRQQIDSAIFEGFTPLNNLDEETLERLARHATIQGIAAGDFLFERGDTTSRTFYLLEGEIELCSPLSPTQKISARSEAGRYPIAHAFPRQVTAMTISDVKVIVLPLDISEVMTREMTRTKPAQNIDNDNAWERRWLESPMLRRLKSSQKKAILASMEEIPVQAGSVIIHQDEVADSYYVIKQGRCSVSRKPSPGARDVKLAELTEGQGFGEEALITNVPRNASVTMLNDGILLRLSKDDFIKNLAKPLLHMVPFSQAMQEVEKGAVLIDVRTPEEFEIDGLVGSLNMPIPVLRLKANRLKRDRLYIIYSNTGQTSSVAVFLLIQQGLNAYVLEGGLNTAPKYRMKRGGFGGQGENDEFDASNTVLPFPGNHTPSQETVDWHNVSDDVLWRTTLGMRDDAGVEAALSAKPAPMSAQTDNTLQGFDDIRLFTKIDISGDPRQPSHHKDTRAVFSEPKQDTGYRPHSMGSRPTNPAPPRYYQHNNRWDDTPSSSLTRRILLGTVLTALLLAGGAGIYYFTKGELPANIEAASPMLMEQQRKLDDKVNRLLDAIETLPAFQSRPKENGESTVRPPEAGTSQGNLKETPGDAKTGRQPSQSPITR